MVQLQADQEKFSREKIQVVGISPDLVDVLKLFSEKRGITFPLLSDEGSRTIHLYGIHNQRGLPHPATFLIGQDGAVRAKLAIEGYRDRHSNAALLEAAKQMN